MARYFLFKYNFVDLNPDGNIVLLMSRNELISLYKRCLRFMDMLYYLGCQYYQPDRCHIHSVAMKGMSIVKELFDH